MQKMSRNDKNKVNAAMGSIKGLRDKLLTYYTTGEGRLDDGIITKDDGVIDNGIIKGYSSVEVFIKPEDEPLYIEKTKKFLDENKDEITIKGLHPHYAKRIDEPGLEVFIFFFELSGEDEKTLYPGDYEWFNFKLSEPEIQAMNERANKMSQPEGNINRKLYEEDIKEGESRESIIKPAGRHI